MAETSDSGIFNNGDSPRLTSPDDLEKYMRVTSLQVWVLLGLCAVLLVGLVIWGFFGSISTNLTVTGSVIDGTPICMLTEEEVAQVKVGDEALVDGREASVAVVYQVPLTRDEAEKAFENDYLVNALIEGDWSYLVELSSDSVGDLKQEVPIPITITTSKTAPVSLVMK